MLADAGKIFDLYKHVHTANSFVCMAVTNWLFHTFDRTRTIHTDTHVRTVHCTHFMANAITKNQKTLVSSY